jgi:FKBP-type peptidyl-prolyl cis-trans isomerase FkpA
MKALFWILGFAVLLSACGKDELSVEEQFNADIKLIEAYLSEKGLTAQKTPDGVYYIIETEGTADKPKITSTVTVSYLGYFLDGQAFDGSDKATFPLYAVIQGWQIGIPKFGKGGKGKLLIPSKYAYGQNSVGGRKNAVLIFDIEVFDF